MDKQKRKTEKIIKSLLEMSTMSEENYLVAREQTRKLGLTKEQRTANSKFALLPLTYLYLVLFFISLLLFR